MSDDQAPLATPGSQDRATLLARLFVYVGGSIVLVSVLSELLLAVFPALAAAAKPRDGGVAPDLGGAFLIIWVFCAPVLWLWTLWFRRVRDRRSFRSLGFDRPGALRRFGSAWLLGFAAPGAILVLGLLAGAYEWGVPAPVLSTPSLRLLGFRNLVDQGFFSVALVVVPLAIAFLMQSATEELLVRGYLQTNLLERWGNTTPGFVASLLVPAAIFALGHLANPGVNALALVNTLLWGILFALVTWRQGSLWGAIGAHSGWNFGLGVVWSLPLSGIEVVRLLPVLVTSRGENPLVFGGYYGPEAGLVCTAGLLLVIAAVVPRR